MSNIRTAMNAAHSIPHQAIDSAISK